MRRRLASFAILLAFAGAPGLAGGVRVEIGRDADLSDYATWSWEKGTAADDDRVQQLIEQAVERELQAAGLTRAENGGELLVTTFAISEEVTGTTVAPGYWGGGSDFGVPTVDIGGFRKGLLMVNLKDAEADEVVWRASGKAKLQVGQGAGFQRKVEALVRKIFKKFPR